MDYQRINALLAHTERIAARHSHQTPNTWCVYVTSCVRTGQFYIGKTNLAGILNGTYVGSGVNLHAAIKQTHTDLGLKDETGFSPGSARWLPLIAKQCGWTTEILETFKNEKCALVVEAQLIREFNRSSLCLNKTMKVSP